MQEIQRSSDTAERIRSAAITLINDEGVAAVSVAVLCDSAGVTREEFERFYPSVNEVFAGIVQSLLRAYGERLSATLMRRRSLNESILLANVAFLDVVAERVAEHQALTLLRVADIGKPGTVPVDVMYRSLHEALIANTELWLVEVARVHDVHWELATLQLAVQQVGYMTGMVLDYLAREDYQSSRQLLEIISFDLARRGRRKAKNLNY